MSQPAQSETKPPGLRLRGKQRRTDRILDAALALLRENPEQNLTVDRIAERAEVAPMTVYNLVGTRDQIWTALVDRALQDVDPHSITAPDPQERARRITDAYVRVLRADAPVFTALLSGWSNNGRVLGDDPTTALIDCLQQAADAGQLSPGVNVRRHGEVLAAGLLGTIHQWTAGIINDRQFATRARAVVDIVFTAARNADTE
jgi:AcrR family transcriptional regulator